MKASGPGRTGRRRTRRRLWFLSAGTRPKTCWPIEGSSSAEAVAVESSADAIADARVDRGEIRERSQEAVRETGVLVQLLGSEATSRMQCP